MAGNSPDVGRSVLSRALAVLGVFSAERPEHTLASIVSGTGLSAATAYRLVGELVDWGALERVQRGRYQIGIRLWRIGSLAPSARILRDVALPFLQDLQSATGHHVHLVVADGPRMLFVERLRARGVEDLPSQVGGQLPLHASSPGKVLLAYAPAEYVEQVVALGLPRLGPKTITERDELMRALADIRLRGFSVSRGEMTADTASVAAPVVNAAGEVVAGVSVVAPNETENLQPLVAVVQVTAMAISRALGAPGGSSSTE